MPSRPAVYSTNQRAGKKPPKVTYRLPRGNLKVTIASFVRFQIDARQIFIRNEYSKLTEPFGVRRQLAQRLRCDSSSKRGEEQRIMAKPILQTIRVNHSIEPTLPGLEAGAGLRLLAKIMQVVKPLAVSLQDRRRRKFVEAYIPRQSHEDERRLEFERFIHW